MPAVPFARIRESIGRWLPAALLLSGLWACSAHPGVYHTVEPGQTLYGIGRAYGVDANHLARVNGVHDPANLRAGQRLYIPEATTSVPVPRTTQAPIAVRPPTPKAAPQADPPAAPGPNTGAAPAIGSAPSSSSSPPKGERKASTPPAVEKGRFQWPLKGTVVRQFGTAGGTLSKGIEIACAPGSTVRSAAAGKVIYSGDGVAGYGNLIILRHEDGFFSVYGFNSKNLVSVGTVVTRGLRIALSGTPPSGGSPRLYFEIRNGKDAVDPIFYLP